MQCGNAAAQVHTALLPPLPSTPPGALQGAPEAVPGSSSGPAELSPPAAAAGDEAAAGLEPIQEDGGSGEGEDEADAWGEDQVDRELAAMRRELGMSVRGGRHHSGTRFFLRPACLPCALEVCVREGGCTCMCVTIR